MTTVRNIDYSTNLLESILWQYDNATNLISLLNEKQAWYDENQSLFFSRWFNNVFYLFNPRPSDDPDAFNAFGASVWSILLQIPLQVGAPPDPPGTQIFEFNNPENFNNGAFSTGNTTVLLDIDDSALLLRLRYYQLVTNGALGTLPPTEANPAPVPGILDFIRYVFGMYTKYNGTITVIDDFNMEMTYVFSQALPASLKYILDNYDILPRPAGVKINIVISTDLVFAFNNPQNFNNGAFVQRD